MAVLKSYDISMRAYLAGFNKTGTDPNTASNKIATAIAMAESSGRTDARNPSGARGLWQIMPGTAAMVGADYSQLDDPTYNARTAFRVYKAQGWGAWSVYNSGAYKKHLDEPTSPPLPGIPTLPGADTLTDVGAGLHDIGRAGAWLGNPRNWLRVLQVVAGGVLVIGALVVLAKPVLEPAAAAAAKVATKGLVK